ncbi:MAG: hypothetical protein J6A47_01000 [Bacilli bacterium]|nr:hypothetical protein [Bacilli bacterium]
MKCGKSFKHCGEYRFIDALPGGVRKRKKPILPRYWPPESKVFGFLLIDGLGLALP